MNIYEIHITKPNYGGQTYCIITTLSYKQLMLQIQALIATHYKNETDWNGMNYSGFCDAIKMLDETEELKIPIEIKLKE